MFEFLFRRGKSAAKPPAAGPTAGGSKPSGKNSTPTQTAPAPRTAESRQAAAAQLRAEALVQAEVAARDEATAIAFACAATVPEARLLAAQAIHGRAGLEQVRRALRDTDRRVVRLMQQRLDQLARDEASEQQAQAVLAQARMLASEPALRANRLVALEQSWQAIGSVPDALHQEYTQLHATLGTRLQAQAALQRRLLDGIASVRLALAPAATAETAPAASEPHTDPGPDASGLAQDALLRQTDWLLQDASGDAELAGLPRQLLPELQQLRAQLHERLDAARLRAEQQAARAENERQALLAREAAQAASQAAAQAQASSPAAADLAADSAADSAADPSAMPPTDPSAPATDAATATPSRDKPVRAAAKKIMSAVESAEQREKQAAALAALQAALEDGALLKAMEQDRALRILEGEGVNPAPAQRSALQAARAELGRLQGWARWGGAVSRDELVASVEALPQQALPIGELAKKVGSMRERWRSLDASAGAAPRAAWVRFDAACTAAYAPVAAHQAALSAQRAANADQARALLGEIDAFRTEQGIGVASAPQGSVDAATPSGADTDADADAGRDYGNHGDVSGGTAGIDGAASAAGAAVDISTAAADAERDWRAISAFCQRMRHAWQRLGPLERREQKRLDTAFGHALQPLLLLLDARQAHELAARERLIAEVAMLSPTARDTPERLQALQARWQQQAKALPLPRAQEQAAWVQFRAACDAVFAARKQVGAEADAQRAASLSQKQALCVELEAIAATDADTGASADNPDKNPDRPATARLRAIRLAWDAAGPVPRAAQDALQARYDKALAAIDARAQATRQAAASRQREALLRAVMLCLDTEQSACTLGSAEGGSVTGAPGSADAATLRASWERLPALPKEIGRSLEARRDAALQALTQPDPAYARRLDAAQSERDVLLLRLEVAFGIASPPRLTRERMAQQVAGLQSAFKGSGNAASGAQTLLAALIALPATADAEARQRISAIIAAAQAA